MPFDDLEVPRMQTRRRAVTVALAPPAALTVWAAARLLGVDLHVTRGGSMSTVGALDVLAAALAGALAAWGVVRLIEHRACNPRRLFAQIAVIALATSVVGPTHLAAGSSAIALIGMHVATATVVLVGFAGTLRAPGCEPADVADVHRPARDLTSR